MSSSEVREGTCLVGRIRGEQRDYQRMRVGTLAELSEEVRTVRDCFVSGLIRLSVLTPWAVGVFFWSMRCCFACFRLKRCRTCIR